MMDLCMVGQFVTYAGLMYGSVKWLVSQIVIGQMVGQSNSNRSNIHFSTYRSNGWSVSLLVGQTVIGQ